MAQRVTERRSLGQAGPDPRLAFIEPEIPALVDKPPEGEQWFHEIKYDGYRSQIAIAGGEVRVYTRNGYDWTKKYRRIADAALALGRDARIDGEIIVQDEAGRPDFHSLRRSVMWGDGRLIFVAFDLLSVDGHDLRRLPCEERRAKLRELLASVTPADPIHFSEAFHGSGAEFFAAIERMGLEGMVSKRRASLYRSGRQREWLKTKTFMESQFTVIGYDRRPGEVPTLLLAAEEGGALRYAGRAMVTLPSRERDALWKRLDKRRMSAPALREMKVKGVEWVKPGLPVRVRHLRGEQMLRHATVIARQA